MTKEFFYGLLADTILVVHFAFVAFVVLGLLAVWIGYFLRWNAVRNFYFRASHLLCMGIVVSEALGGVTCPITIWESELRVLAGDGTYQGSFMQHWIHKIMFFDLSPGTFTVIYVVFFLVLALSLVLVRPRWPAWLKKSPPGPPPGN